MREKAKELQRQKMDATRKGIKSSFGGGSSFGNSSSYTPTPSVGDVANVSNDVKPSYTPAQAQKPRGMKLGGKGRDVESFVDQLKSEGEKVTAQTNSILQPGGKAPAIKTDVDE